MIRRFFQLLIVAAFFISCGQREDLPVRYLFASHCNSCGEIEKRMETLAAAFKKAGGVYKLQVELYNVLIPSQYDPAMTIIDELDVPPSARNLPLLVCGGAWFYGEEAILAALEELEAGRVPEGESGG